MSERDFFAEAPAAEDEIRAARGLADALDGKAADAADLEALAVVRLLETVSPASAPDEVAARRARKAAARRPVRVARIAAIAAALAGVALLGLFLRRAPVRPSESVLVARERAARAAVVAVVGSWSAGDEAGERIAAVSDQQWHLRLAAEFDAARLDELAAASAGGATVDRTQAAPRATRTVPTPGGTS